MKKVLMVVLIVSLVLSVAACTASPVASSAPASSAAPASVAPASSAAPASVAPASSAAAASAVASSGAKGGKEGAPYVAMVCKGFQHKFWQTVWAGAQDAATKDNLSVTFDGPPSESDIGPQVDMVNAALAKNPKVLCLAALDTTSLNEQLQTCITKKIPVIGFDSGVPNAPEGSIYSTAATNNQAAAALACDKLFADAPVAAALKAATTDKPVVIGVVSQDATSASLTDRATGFVNEAVKLAEQISSGNVSVTGHDKWKKASTSGKTAIEIFVNVSASSSVPDCQTAAMAVLQKKPLGIFVSNAGTVDGMLAATTDGSDLDRATGKYKDVAVVGFDSGAALINAINKKWFFGAITQDPYQIGYQAIELASKVIGGQQVPAVVDTGCKFYDSTNINDPDIAKLLYQ